MKRCWRRKIWTAARYAERAMVLDAIAMGGGDRKAVRVGGPLLFSRLWERLGIAEVLGGLQKARGFEFPVERAVFVGVLHRLFVSGSDRACENWMEDY